MNESDAEIEAFVVSAARLLDLDLRDDRRPGVVANLRNFLSLYRTVEGFDEPAAHDPLGIYAP